MTMLTDAIRMLHKRRNAIYLICVAVLLSCALVFQDLWVNVLRSALGGAWLPYTSLDVGADNVFLRTSAKYSKYLKGDTNATEDLVDDAYAIEGSDPRSRVFVLYFPDQPHQKEEVFAFVESWRMIFGVPEKNPLPLPDESQDLNLSSVSFAKNAFEAGRPDSASELLGETPLLINDILILADPRIRTVDVPEICRILPFGNPDPTPFLDVKGRIREISGAFDSSDITNKQHNETTSSVASRCFIIKTYLSTTQFHTRWDIHPAINSVSALVEPIVREALRSYDLAMRSDNDCFLLPGVNSRKAVPWITANSAGTNKFFFLTGRGGYATEGVNVALEEYSKLLGLRHQGFHAIGSTWYGRPMELLRVARLTIKVGEFLLANDPIFLRSHGSWPEWWKGVTLLYSAEIAINHLIDGDRLSVARPELDSGSTGTESIWHSKQWHIHCWHTDNFYSKFAFRSGRYTQELFYSPEYDVTQKSWYSFTMVWNGRLRARLQQKLHEISVAHTGDIRSSENEALINPSSLEEHDVPILPGTKNESDPFSFSEKLKEVLYPLIMCPSSNPHPFKEKDANSGSHCCSVPPTCQGGDSGECKCSGTTVRCVIPPCRKALIARQ